LLQIAEGLVESAKSLFRPFSRARFSVKAISAAIAPIFVRLADIEAGEFTTSSG
jgi:hypothetical protein